MIKPTAPLSALAACLLGPTVAGNATAATIVEDELLLPAMACQAALPVFDGQIRKRPLAIQNEGTSNAFITCALRGRFGGTSATTGTSAFVTVGLINNTGSSRTATCTLVDGRNGLIDPINFVKSATFTGTLEMALTAAAVNSGTPFY